MSDQIQHGLDPQVHKDDEKGVSSYAVLAKMAERTRPQVQEIVTPLDQKHEAEEIRFEGGNESSSTGYERLEENQIDSSSIGYDSLEDGERPSLDVFGLWWPTELSQDEMLLATTKWKLNPALCKYCRLFFSTWTSATHRLLQDEEVFELSAPHHTTIEKLENSAHQGCHLCGLFVNIMHMQFETNLKEKHGFLHSAYQPLGVITLDHVQDDFWTISVEMKIIQVYVSVNLTPLETLGPISIADTLEAKSDLSQIKLGCRDDSLLLVQRWMKECDTSHETCRHQSQGEMPTRLIKIEAKRIRLCLTTEQDDCSIYTTLSHCWGGIDYLRLLKSNYADFLCEIPPDSICKTFRDAVDIARVLGFSWIWIDSLCIIQDDPADWQRESAFMTSVYGSSSLNLAATAAPDGRKGCLFERDPIQIHTQVEVEFNKRKKAYHCFPSDGFHYNLELAPLAKRAWVLQERVLASRTLHFASSQLFWECRTKLTCEAFPDKIPLTLRHHPIQNLWTSWPSMVIRYSELNLTVPSDKLVAIAGIARKLGQQSGDEYLAGLWRRRFLEGLCWFTKSEADSTSVRNRDVRVPSWSWASVQVPVHMPSDDFEVLTAYINILDISIRTINDDSFSGVRGGTLTLRTTNMLRIIVKSNCLGYFTRALRGARLYKHSNNILYWDVYLDPSEGFMFLPIGIFSDNLTGLYGMVLKETGIQNGQYERVGFFTLRGGLKDNILDEKWNSMREDLIRSGEAIIPVEGDYVSAEADKNGEMWYSITII